MVDERVTLYSDPADPLLLGRPFDADGLPVGRTVWIEKGVLKNLAYSRFWAQKQGVQPIPQGWRVRPDRRDEDNRGTSSPGVSAEFWSHTSSTSGHSTRAPVLQTGLTRDGVFLIEKGKITRALKNFRWNESPLLMLNRLEDIGRSELTEAGQMMPALRIRDFNFASSSDAV